MSEDMPTYEPFTAVRAADGSLHGSVEEARAHDRAQEAEKTAKAFVAYTGLKGRSKRPSTELIAAFVLWVQQGKPEKPAE